MLVGVVNGPGDLGGSLRSLDPDGQELHIRQRIPLAKNPQHIVHRRTGGAGDDADGPRQLRQGLLVGRVKESLGGELGLELFKGGVEVADAIQSQAGAIQLVHAVPDIDRHGAHGDDLHAVLRPEP